MRQAAVNYCHLDVERKVLYSSTGRYWQESRYRYHMLSTKPVSWGH